MNEVLFGAPVLMTEELEQVLFLRQFAWDPALRADRLARRGSGVTKVSHRAQMPPYELERSRPQELTIRRRPSVIG